MTGRDATIVLSASFAVSLLLGATLFARLGASRSRADAAVAAAARTEDDVARLASLRDTRRTVATGFEPQADALALLNAAMAAARLPASHVRSLAPLEQVGPRSDATAAGYEHRSLRLVLAGLSMPEFGTFLTAWRESQAIWTVREISLRSEASRPDIEPRWTATMTLTATYWPGSATEEQTP